MKTAVSEQTINAGLEHLLARLKHRVPNPALLGIGLDIETNRLVHPRAGRFFLSQEEQKWLEEQTEPASSSTLLRLWTVKEAIFKADPENNETLLGDYILNNPLEWAGHACRRDRKLFEFHYSTIEVEDGFLSIAVLATGEHDA